jgi:cystathionine beta-lyase
MYACAERKENMNKFNKISTTLIHGGIDGDERTGAVNVPIYQTSTYRQEQLGKHKGYEYSRTGNPTREALEKLIADLEQGLHGLAFASGMAATTAVLTLFETGDKILISKNVYGGTFRVLDKIFSQFGIRYDIVDTTDLKILENALSDEVKAVFIESPANPLMTVTDIEAVAGVTKKHGKLLIVDNTFMTPYLQRPLTLGADIIVHSATKYLGGHSDLIAGLVVVNDDELAEKLYFIQNATGGILQPFDAFLLIRGIKTLGIRLDRHQENGKAVAEWLSNQDAVKRVYYPGLITDEGYEIQKKQADGPGAMISFELKEEYHIEKFFGQLKLIALAESLGGVESLVCHPSSMTHASIPEKIRKQVGITDHLIRLSVGIEDKEDIIADLKNAILLSK